MKRLVGLAHGLWSGRAITRRGGQGFYGGPGEDKNCAEVIIIKNWRKIMKIEVLGTDDAKYRVVSRIKNKGKRT
jgi:hypothetical protein